MNIPIEEKFKEKPNLHDNIWVRPDQDTNALIREIAKRKKTPISTVARVLMQAGAAQYRKEKGQ